MVLDNLINIFGVGGAQEDSTILLIDGKDLVGIEMFHMTIVKCPGKFK